MNATTEAMAGAINLAAAPATAAMAANVAIDCKLNTHHSLYKKVIKFNFFIIKIIGL